MIVNLGSKKGGNNEKSSPKLSCLQNSSMISIVDTIEKNLSYVEGKSVTRKVHTFSLK